MKNVFKGLEVNENDNFGTAIGKGLAIGAINSGVTILALAGTAFVAGKLIGKKDVVELEEVEAE